MQRAYQLCLHQLGVLAEYVEGLVSELAFLCQLEVNERGLLPQEHTQGTGDLRGQKELFQTVHNVWHGCQRVSREHSRGDLPHFRFRN